MGKKYEIDSLLSEDIKKIKKPHELKKLGRPFKKIKAPRKIQVSCYLNKNEYDRLISNIDFENSENVASYVKNIILNH